MTGPLLADISVEVIFFLVAAIIALVNKLYEKSRELRKRSQAQIRAREKQQRLDLVRVGTEVVEAPEAEEERPPPKAFVVRPPRTPTARPPRRTERIVVPAVKRVPVPRARAARPRIEPDFIRRLRRDPAAMREAIILREVLGPPVAMRGFRFPRR